MFRPVKLEEEADTRSSATGGVGLPVQRCTADGSWVNAVIEKCRRTVPEGQRKVKRCYDLVGGAQGVHANMLRPRPLDPNSEEGIGSCEYLSNSAGK